MKIQPMFLTVILIASAVSADLLHLVSFNPGFKIGYEFGKKSGFIVGIESSVTYSSPYYYLISPWGGIVGGIQWNFNNRRFMEYWEIEGGWFLAGIAWGGEWDEKYYTRFRIFGGFLGYLSYKVRINGKANEFSLVGKVPYDIYAEQDYGTYLLGKKISE
jgi:hypothetical protein